MYGCVMINRWVVFNYYGGCYLIWFYWVFGLYNFNMFVILFNVYYILYVEIKFWLFFVVIKLFDCFNLSMRFSILWVFVVVLFIYRKL